MNSYNEQSDNEQQTNHTIGAGGESSNKGGIGYGRRIVFVFGVE